MSENGKDVYLLRDQPTCAENSGSKKHGFFDRAEE